MDRKDQERLQEEDVVDLQVLVADGQENETDVEEAEDDAVVDVVDEGWRTWPRKRKIGRRKITRSIPAKTVWSLTRAWSLVRFLDAKALGVTDGDRATLDGDHFDIKGITRDLKSRDAAFLICELGGNEG